MKLKAFVVGLSLLSLVTGAFFITTAGADAHERRNVQAYTFVVGWLGEPAIVNQPNSIDLRISKTADSSPVAGLEKTLKAEVSTGSKKLDVPLASRFGTPGAYNGYVMPTKTGDYTFKFTGTIEGASISETFNSGPGRFSSIEAPNAFPDPVGDMSASTEAAKGLEQRVVQLEAQHHDEGSDSSAMIVGILGVVLGIAGLAAGGLALTRKSA